MVGAGFLLWLRRRGHDQSEDNNDVPEIFRARFMSLPQSQPLPPLLLAALAKVSPETTPDTSCAFVRSMHTCPKHFLHSTLRRQGSLGQALYYFQQDDKCVVSRVFTCWPLTSELEGPPNFCHGGCVASLMDDAFGAFTNTHLRSAGRSGEAVTAYLHVDYKKPTPLSGSIVCVVELDRVDGRKVFAKGYMLVQTIDSEWVVTCEANALFIELKEGFAGMKQTPGKPP